MLNHYVFLPQLENASSEEILAGWQTSWYIFATYAAVVAILFAIFFKGPKKPVDAASVGH